MSDVSFYKYQDVQFNKKIKLPFFLRNTRVAANPTPNAMTRATNMIRYIFHLDLQNSAMCNFEESGIITSCEELCGDESCGKSGSA